MISASHCPLASKRMVYVSPKLPFHLVRNEGQIFSKLNIHNECCPFQPVSNSIWVGWSGINSEDYELLSKLNKNILPVRVDLPTLQKYEEFCEETLWPFYNLMHSKVVTRYSNWKIYDEVNKIFANRIVDACQLFTEDILVWIHGYQLMMVPHWLRQRLDEKNLHCKIGFRFQAGFPSWYIFKLFPLADEVLQAVLACDLVGFETLSNCINFIECCEMCLGCRVDKTKLLVEHGNRSVMIRQIPIDVDFNQVRNQAEAIIPAPNTKKVVVSVNRFEDIQNTVQAFETLLTMRDDVIIRIIIISNEFLKPTETLISTSSIQYKHNLEDQNELISFYRNADVCLMSSVGLANYMTAFLASQVDSSGVLMIPLFSSLFEIMPEAIHFNSRDSTSFIDSLQRALDLPQDEKRARINSLRKRFKHHTSSNFLENLCNIVEVSVPKATLDDFEYLSQYIGHKNVVLLLDYDGTLAPIAPHPDLATLPLGTKKVLEQLRENPDCFISIISGRNLKNVGEMVGIKNIVYAGNHGLEISFPDGANYVHPMPEDTKQKIQRLQEELEKNVHREGAWVENKSTALTFHFRKVAENLHDEIEKKAKKIIEAAGFKTGKAHCAVEAKPIVDWNKGRASMYILNKVFGAEWYDNVAVFYIGDDVTDEDAMRVLKGLGLSFRVVSSTVTKTSADKRLPSTETVVTFLEWIQNYLNRRMRNK